VKYLRRPKQGKLGLVLPTQEKNLHINLDENRLKKIAGLEPTGKDE
jgi:predicted ribosome quality control (RQC) complex YloA/Tae2 family protein